MKNVICGFFFRSQASSHRPTAAGIGKDCGGARGRRGGSSLSVVSDCNPLDLFVSSVHISFGGIGGVRRSVCCIFAAPNLECVHHGFVAGDAAVVVVVACIEND